MKVWGVNETQLKLIADEVGVKLNNLHEDGRAWNFTLRPTGVKIDGDYKYQRTSASGFHADRRVHAVCWHGHRDFMLAIYKREPEARIKTMWADYRGVEDFLEKYPQTAYRNVGSLAYPMRAYEICNCALGGWMVDLSIFPDVQEFRMQQANIKRCPFSIFTPEHYNADGSCKCSDPEHRKFMKREWEYTDADFERVGVA